MWETSRAHLFITERITLPKTWNMHRDRGSWRTIFALEGRPEKFSLGG